MHHFLTFSAALGTLSKLNCTRLHENLLWDFRLRPKQLNSKNDCGQFSPRLDKGKNSFPRARVTHFFPRKTLQLYTNLLNCLFYIKLRVYGLRLKPVISDGFVLSWNWLTIFWSSWPSFYKHLILHSCMRQVSSATIREIILIICKIVFTIRKIFFPVI